VAYIRSATVPIVRSHHEPYYYTTAACCHTRHSNTQLWQLFVAVPNVRTAFLPTA